MKLNRKNKGLIIGFILTLLLCYHLAIKKTLSYYYQYKTQEQVIDNRLNSPNVLADLAAREKQLDRWLSKNENQDSSFQNKLLKELNAYCLSHNLKVTDFKEPHTISRGQTQISSYLFSVEGHFNSALGLINKLENISGLGAVKHLVTEKKMNYKTNTPYVVTTVLIQKSNLP